MASVTPIRLPPSVWNAIDRLFSCADALAGAVEKLKRLWTFRSACWVFLSVNVLLNLVWVVTKRHGLNDLGSFLHSGAAFREGLNPYAYYPALHPQPISPEALNLNPPISVYAFGALSRLNPSVVEAMFIVGSALLLGVAVVLLMAAYPNKRNAFTVLTVLSFAGVWHMFWYLQLYAPLVLAVTASWLLMRRGNLVWAGVLLGFVMAVKPNYALLAFLLIAAGYYRVALPSLATAGLISLVPVIASGPQIYQQWIHLTLDFKGIAWTSNASLESVASRLDLPFAGPLCVVLLVTVVVWWLRRARPGLLDATALGLMTVVLVGPVSWAGYTLFLLPFLFSKQWDGRIWLAIILLAMPFSPKGASGAADLTLINIDLPFHAFAAALSSVGQYVTPISRSVYAWATILLLTQVLKWTQAEDLLPHPSQVTTRSDARETHLGGDTAAAPLLTDAAT